MALSISDRAKLSDFFKTQPVVAVYLFGSQATGLNNSQSDVDIAILFDESVKVKERFIKKLEILGTLTFLLKRDNIDLVVLNDAPIALRFSAIKPQELIYKENNEKMISFEAKTLSDYQDYYYYINQNTIDSLGSISQM
ncbi:MAG: nucleotidyltransferase domain-containing protein [Patescibacteria group bacterium]